MSENAPPGKSSTLWSELRAVLDLVLDFSFQHFVTPRLIRLLYALSLMAAVLAALTWMFRKSALTASLPSTKALHRDS